MLIKLYFITFVERFQFAKAGLLSQYTSENLISKYLFFSKHFVAFKIDFEVKSAEKSAGATELPNSCSDLKLKFI